MRFVFENCEIIEVPNKDIVYFSIRTSGEQYYLSEENSLEKQIVSNKGLIIFSPEAEKSACYVSTWSGNDISPLERFLKYPDLTNIIANGLDFNIQWNEKSSEESNLGQKTYRNNANELVIKYREK